MSDEQVNTASNLTDRWSGRRGPAQSVEQPTIREELIFGDVLLGLVERRCALVDRQQHFERRDVSNTREMPFKE